MDTSYIIKYAKYEMKKSKEKWKQMRNFKGMLKGYVLGVLTVVLLMTAGMAVFAASVNQNISVTFRNIRIFMNGEELVPTDALGNRVEPFIFDGTTYLPVRAVAEAFGKHVQWDPENAFIHLDSEHAHVELDPTANISTWLNHMPIADHNPPADGRGVNANAWLANGVWGSNQRDNQENTHDQGGIMAGNNTWSTAQHVGNGHTITYNLNGEFDRFIGTIAVSWGSRRNTVHHQIRFIADGNVIYSSPVITGNTAPIPFNVDVSDVNMLTIERVVLSQTGNGNAEIGIVNAGFTR